MSAKPSLQHTIKLVDTKTNCLNERSGVTYTHQVARSIEGQVCERSLQGRQHLLARFTNRQSPDAVTIKVEFCRARCALCSQIGINAALNNSKQ